MSKEKTIEVIKFPEEFYIAAADLSLKRPGFCCCHIKNNTIEDIKTTSCDNKTKTKPHGQLLSEIRECFVNFYKNIDINNTYFVREKAFNARAAQSEMGIYKVVGMMDLLLYDLNSKEWSEIYPVTVKKYVTGKGKATKEEVQSALPFYIGEREWVNDDESDSVAVCLAFLIQNKVIQPKEADDLGS